MTPEEYKWHISLVKERYNSLNLSNEQAEQIEDYEKERDTFSEKTFFSVWEEWDYEISIFRQILTSEQLKDYEEYMFENIKSHEEWLIKQDGEKENEINYIQEMLTYYENKFLPDLLKDQGILPYSQLSSNKPKIEFLKSEYRAFLNDRKKQIIAEHFRHNRLFKPNELKAALLKHKLAYLWPNYGLFKHTADSATKAVIDHLKMTIKQLPNETEELLTRKFDELKIFNNGNLEKYFGDIKGWHVIIGQLTKDEEQEESIMSLLLLDTDKYRG